VRRGQPLYQKPSISTRAFREKHPDTAKSYNSLASNLNAQGKYAEARPLFQKALDLRIELLGEKHPDSALCYNNLAVNLSAQGKHPKPRIASLSACVV